MICKCAFLHTFSNNDYYQPFKHFVLMIDKNQYYCFNILSIYSLIKHSKCIKPYSLEYFFSWASFHMFTRYFYSFLPWTIFTYTLQKFLLGFLSLLICRRPLYFIASNPSFIIWFDILCLSYFLPSLKASICISFSVPKFLIEHSFFCLSFSLWFRTFVLLRKASPLQNYKKSYIFF